MDVQRAANLIRSTRIRAGLSQAELARRADLPRSVLCAYERASREPGADTLIRILAAAGFEVRAVPALRALDEQRAARVLADVLDLAGALPYRPRRQLAYPPLRARVAS